MDYNTFTKEELIEKLKHFEEIIEAQDLLVETIESNNLSSTKAIHELLLDAFSTFENKYNLMNASKTILFKLERTIAECEPFLANGAKVIAKAQLVFSVTERQVLTGTSQSYVLQSPTFNFHNHEQIEEEGWEEILYSEILRGFLQCVLQVFHASKT